MMEKFKCEKCGKEYKSERFYKQHIEKCSDIEEYEEKVLDIFNSLEEEKNIKENIKETIIEKTEKDETIEKLIELFNRLKGNTPGSTSEWIRLFRWRNILIGDNKAVDVNCLSCRRAVYNTLNGFYNMYK